MNFADLLWEAVQRLKELLKRLKFEKAGTFSHNEKLWQKQCQMK